MLRKRYLITWFIISAFLMFTGINTVNNNTVANSQTIKKTAVLTTEKALTFQQADSLQSLVNTLPIQIYISDAANVNELLTPKSIVEYLLSMIGAFLSTLILALLHKKFPKLFPSKNINKYK